MKRRTVLIVAVVIAAVLVGAQLAGRSILFGKDGRRKPAADLMSHNGEGCPIKSSVDRMPASAKSWQHEPFREGIPIAYHARFDCEQFARLQDGLVPRQMEEKWFIYYEEPYLFLHRSWTGQPVFRVTLQSTGNGVEVAEALWSKDLAKSTDLDSKYQVQLIDFLVSNLLLRQSKPFPVPAGLTGSQQQLYQHVVSGTHYPPSSQASKEK